MLKDKHIIWDYLDTGGQIIKALIDGPVKAGQIYKLVSASQPAISKKLARMQDEGIIEARRDFTDRRVVWYALSDKFLEKLLSDPFEVRSVDPVPFVKWEEK